MTRVFSSCEGGGARGLGWLVSSLAITSGPGSAVLVSRCCWRNLADVCLASGELCLLVDVKPLGFAPKKQLMRMFGCGFVVGFRKRVEGGSVQNRVRKNARLLMDDVARRVGGWESMMGRSHVCSPNGCVTLRVFGYE